MKSSAVGCRPASLETNAWVPMTVTSRGPTPVALMAFTVLLTGSSVASRL